MKLNRVIVAGIFACVAICVLVVGGLRAQQSSTTPHSGEGMPPAQTADKTAEQAFKNIQALKGVPADQIIPTMQFITASLGVECDFCHVQGAFDKDDKKTKQTARKMMEMMFAINADNFDRHREVTCYSCHRGAAKPVGMPPVMEADAREPMGPPHRPEGAAAEKDAKNLPTGELLLDKYVKAVGGAAAVDKNTSRIMKGTITFGEQSLPIDIYSKDPDMRISFTHMPEGDNVTAFNGHEGWLGVPKRPLREMHGPDLDGASIDADLHLATHLKSMFSETKVAGTEKVDEHEAYSVVGQREGKTPLHLYFDAQTGLLVRLVRFGETALGQMPTQIDYADYRDAGGVKIPYRWTLARPGGRFTIQINDVQQNAPVDDAKFVKPAAEPPKGKTQ